MERKNKGTRKLGEATDSTKNRDCSKSRVLNKHEWPTNTNPGGEGGGGCRSMKRLEVLSLPLDKLLSPSQVTFQLAFCQVAPTIH